MSEKKVENYNIGEVLGQGSFARVYKCENEKDGKQYAMKVIKRQSLSPNQVKRLKIEIAIMQSINHANIVHLYDLLSTDARYMLVMDLVEGGELMSHIDGPLPEAKAAEYLIQIASATRFCHGLGIVHRDLKFENVLMKKDGTLVITDFGLGNISNSPDKTFFTSKTLCGSPHYIAPEVTEGGKYDGRNADIWSLGVLFFAMLTYEFPFNDPEYFKIFQLAKEGKYPVPTASSKEAQELLKMILVPDPDKRAQWEDIFNSKFFMKYAKLSSENEITILQNKQVCKFWPTQKDMLAQQQMHEKAGVPLVEKKKDANGCPFCEENINIQQTCDCPNWTVKKAISLQGISDVFQAMSILVQALRNTTKKEITVQYHQQRVTADEFELKLFSPSAGKFFVRIGTQQLNTFENYQNEITKVLNEVKAGKKISLMQVAEVRCQCNQ